jgi:PAS domain S-box-containing protein
MLERLGYKIVGTAISGDEAIKKVEETKPQLVLMDIRIQGPVDGIDVAEHIYAQHDIPVVYLTAYADDTTVDRAKGTLASGYILKPFEERGLKTTIELALYRHNMDRMFKNVEEWHAAILTSLSEAVVAIDTKNRLTYMNKKAEALFGQSMEKLFGHPFEDLFYTEEFKPGSNTSQFFIRKNGEKIPVESKQSAIKDREDNTTGTAFVLREAKF